MSADVRLWPKTQWDRYFGRETAAIGNAYLMFELTSQEFWQAHDNLSQQLKQYILARFKLYQKGYLKELEF